MGGIESRCFEACVVGFSSISTSTKDLKGCGGGEVLTDDTDGTTPPHTTRRQILQEKLKNETIESTETGSETLLLHSSQTIRMVTPSVANVRDPSYHCRFRRHRGHQHLAYGWISQERRGCIPRGWSGPSLRPMNGSESARPRSHSAVASEELPELVGINRSPPVCAGIPRICELHRCRALTSTLRSSWSAN